MTVEGLRVVDKDGKLLMQLGKDSNNIEKDYGLFIYDDSGQFGVIVDVSESGGNVWVIGKNSIGVPGTASMGINESGGIVSIMGKDGDGAGMLMDESGGSVLVSGKGGNAMMRVGENGGAVSVYDKDLKAGV